MLTANTLQGVLQDALDFYVQHGPSCPIPDDEDFHVETVDGRCIVRVEGDSFEITVTEVP